MMYVAAFALLIFAITYKPRTYQFKTVRASRYPSHFVGLSRSQITGGQPSTRVLTGSISTTVSLLDPTTHKFVVPPSSDAEGGTGPEKNCLRKSLIGSIVTELHILLMFQCK